MELFKNIEIKTNFNNEIFFLNFDEIRIVECNIKKKKIKLLQNIFNKLNYNEIVVEEINKKYKKLFIEYYDSKNDFTFYNKYFCKIYLINLDTRKDRLIEMLSLKNTFNINFQIIKAINGKEEPYFSDFYTKTKNINTGEYGYLLTLKNILLDAKRNNYKKILIFDDDIRISKYYYKFEYFSKFINKDWEFLFLGCSQHNWIENINFKFTNYKFLYHPLKTSGTFSIGIKHTIFDELLINIEKYDSPFDSKPIQNIISKNYKKSFALFPNLFIADVSNSDIREPRNIEKFAKKVKWNLQEYYLQIPKQKILIIYFLIDGGNLFKSLYSILNQTYNNFFILIYYDKLDLNIKSSIIDIFKNINVVFCNKNNNTIYNILKKYNNFDIITFLKNDIFISENRFINQVLPFYKNKNILATKYYSNHLKIYDFFYSYKYLISICSHVKYNDYYKYLKNSFIVNNIEIYS